MSFEDDIEKGVTSGKPASSSKMTLQKAVEMGEFSPKYLATFAEWHTLSRHVQFQFINKAIINRRKQLLMQYAEMNNVLDFRLKPEMQKAIKNVLAQLDSLDAEREKFLIEYSK